MGVAARDQREVGHPGQWGGWRECHPEIPATGWHAGNAVAGAARGAQRVTAAPPTAGGFRKNRSGHVDRQSVAERACGRYRAEDHAEIAAGELERDGTFAGHPRLSGIAAIIKSEWPGQTPAWRKRINLKLGGSASVPHLKTRVTFACRA